MDGRLRALLQGMACCCLPHGHGGLWVLRLGCRAGFVPQSRAPCPAVQHLPAPASLSQPAPARQFVWLHRAGQQLSGIAPGGDGATSIAVAFLQHSPCRSGLSPAIAAPAIAVLKSWPPWHCGAGAACGPLVSQGCQGQHQLCHVGCSAMGCGGPGAGRGWGRAPCPV